MKSLYQFTSNAMNNSTSVKVIIYARVKTPPRGFEDDRWDHQVSTCENYALQHGYSVVDLMQDYGPYFNHRGASIGIVGQRAREYHATKLVVLNYDSLVIGDYFRLCYLIWALDYHYGLQVVPVVGDAISRQTDPCYAIFADLFDEVVRK